MHAKNALPSIICIKVNIVLFSILLKYFKTLLNSFIEFKKQVRSKGYDYVINKHLISSANGVLKLTTSYIKLLYLVSYISEINICSNFLSFKLFSKILSESKIFLSIKGIN